VRLWCNGDLPGLELLVALKCNRRWRVIHDTYTVCVVPRASNPDAVLSTWRYRGREHVYRRETLGFMEPGETHAVTRLGTGGDFWVAMLDPVLIARAAVELSLSDPPHLRIAHTNERALLVLFSRLYHAIALGVSPLEQEIRLAACIRLLLETCVERMPATTRPGEHPQLRRAREYLDAHYAGAVGLDELAAAAGLSRFHLARAFTRAYGLPPHQYQIQLRLAAVRRDLRRGVPLAEIDAGFYDQSHLNRHFKQVWGLTPGQYASPPASPLPQFD
jgi:AraC-like DNA-binding protein